MSNKLVLTRTAFDGMAMVMFTTALIHMPLAELSAINLVSPLIITAAAVIFFAEEVGWRRWTAIAVGFVGTLLIVKPTPGRIQRVGAARHRHAHSRASRAT